MPNRNIHRERIKIKRKARNSFSIPKKQCIKGGNTIKSIVQQIPLQGKKVDETDMCSPSTSAAISNDEKGFHEASDSMPNRERQIIQKEKIKIKRTARKSFSIPKKQSSRRQSTTESGMIHIRLPEKDSDENDVCPGISTDTEPCTVDDELETDASIEQLRSSEFMTTEEHFIPYPMLLNDHTDSATFIANCMHHDGGLIASTPYSPSDKKKKYFNFSESVESVKRIAPKHSSTLLRNIPIDKEEPLAIPDVSYINENNEESDSSESSITYSDVIAFQGLEIPENSDKQKVDAKDNEYSKNSCFEDAGYSESMNSSPQSQKYKNVVGNHFEDKDYCNRGVNFGRAQDIHTPKKKGEPYKEFRSLSMKCTHEGSVFDGINQCYTKDTIQNTQNKELQEKEFENTQKETSTRQRLANKKVGHIIHSKLTNSNRHISCRGNSGKSLEEMYDDNSGRCRFGEAMNIQTDIPKRKRSPEKIIQLQTNIRLNTSKKEAKSLNKSKNSVDSRTASFKKQTKLVCDRGNSFAEKVSNNFGDNFERAQNVQIDTREKTTHLHRGDGSVRRKLTNKEGSSFEDINQRYTQDRFETIQHIQNRELQENKNNHIKTSKLQGKDNQKIRHDIIHSKLTNSGRQISWSDGVSNSPEDINSDDGSHCIQEDQPIQTAISQNKSTSFRGNAYKVKRRLNTSKKTPKSLRRSKNFIDQASNEDVQDNQNEEKKIPWPLCCMTSQERNFPILKPVIRYDLPIDDITMLTWDKNSKEECKH